MPQYDASRGIKIGPIHTQLKVGISGGPKMAQVLAVHDFKTAWQNSTKRLKIFSQHVLSLILNFQSRWTTNVKITVV